MAAWARVGCLGPLGAAANPKCFGKSKNIYNINGHIIATNTLNAQIGGAKHRLHRQHRQQRPTHRLSLPGPEAFDSGATLKALKRTHTAYI